MIFDGHVHIRPGEPEPGRFILEMNKAGVGGAVLISAPPDAGTPAKRLEDLMKWTEGTDSLVPFYWIDPLAVGAVGQAHQAIDEGAAGFKIICDRFYPSDRLCMAVCKIAADAGKPVLFHSGILWDGKPSSEYCRPVHFESLLGVRNLRFALAHIGWPWIDEMIALYGKFQNFRTRNPKSKTEMFIDTTPGTPMIYRKEALVKLLTVGYDIEQNIFFGSDCDANEYNAGWTKEWVSADGEILSELGVRPEVRNNIFMENAKRFIEGSEGVRKFRDLSPAVR